LEKNAFLHVFVRLFIDFARKFHAINALRGGKKRRVYMTVPFSALEARPLIFSATH
jgi:hypothetical protein